MLETTERASKPLSGRWAGMLPRARRSWQRKSVGSSSPTSGPEMDGSPALCDLAPSRPAQRKAWRSERLADRGRAHPSRGDARLLRLSGGGLCGDDGDAGRPRGVRARLQPDGGDRQRGEDIEAWKSCRSLRASSYASPWPRPARMFCGSGGVISRGPAAAASAASKAWPRLCAPRQGSRATSRSLRGGGRGDGEPVAPANPQSRDQGRPCRGLLARAARPGGAARGCRPAQCA